MLLGDQEIWISDRKELLQMDRIIAFLNGSYWAKNRPAELIRTSIDNSICFGVYDGDMQIGFARVITDLVTMYYMCDVIIDETYRGRGLGKQLVEAVTNDERLRNLHGILVTADAHGLYEQYGFVRDPDRTLRKKRSQ
ncbi:GNAT family N-acetyltransferase [Paenibacillus dokdonensis]|uniref:GNAT family N-acetyltransferase n=1 Tax=Paenibacillus dokdonensis TaxID=2567944 RepID=A0ABU6GR57_9BACL|nr:GNAT family N-acetyltransferase [Paenibacillus dokdonensis]MEC0242225.1 GNAT family N-acetyltransferase [Paenibacillus dokdonensis]